MVSSHEANVEFLSLSTPFCSLRFWQWICFGSSLIHRKYVTRRTNLSSKDRAFDKSLQSSMKLQMASGCGSVGREVTSDTRDTRFDPHHRQNFIYLSIYQLNNRKDQNKKKEAVNDPSFKKVCILWSFRWQVPYECATFLHLYEAMSKPVKPHLKMLPSPRRSFTTWIFKIFTHCWPKLTYPKGGA